MSEKTEAFREWKSPEAILRDISARLEDLRGNANPYDGVFVTANETPASISQWATATFGPVGSNLSVAKRANRELEELIQKLAADDNHPGAAEELADVWIVLCRLWDRLGADPQAAVNAKMAVNRAREWKPTGDGHGQHVEAGQ